MELFKQVKEYAGERLRSPFIGALLITLIFYHWELIYSLFNFDDSYTLLDKKEFIVSYAQNYNFCTFLVLPILLAIGSLISFYIINTGVLFVSSFYTNRVKPYILSKSDSKDVVLKSRYDQRLKEQEELMKQIEGLEKSRTTADEEHIRDKQELKSEIEEYKKKQLDESDQQEAISKLEETNNSIKEQLEDKKQMLDKIKQGTYSEEIIVEYYWLSNQTGKFNYFTELLNAVEGVASALENNRESPFDKMPDKIVRYYLDQEIIEPNGNDGRNRGNYILSGKGQGIRNIYNFELQKYRESLSEFNFDGKFKPTLTFKNQYIGAQLSSTPMYFSLLGTEGIPTANAKLRPTELDIAFAKVDEENNYFYLLSPDSTGDFGLTQINGVKSTKLWKVDLDFNSASDLDIRKMKISNSKSAKIESGKTYAFQLAEGNKGLIYVDSIEWDESGKGFDASMTFNYRIQE